MLDNITLIQDKLARAVMALKRKDRRRSTDARCAADVVRLQQQLIEAIKHQVKEIDMSPLIFQRVNSFGTTDIWSIEQRVDNGKWVVRKNNMLWTSFDTKGSAIAYVNNIK